MIFPNFKPVLTIRLRYSSRCALRLHKVRTSLMLMQFSHFILGLFLLVGCYSSNPLRLIDKQKAEALETKGYYHVIEKTGDKYLGVTRYTKDGAVFFPAETHEQVLIIIQGP